MELGDFVATTIAQLIEAIEKAQLHAGQHRSVVNPAFAGTQGQRVTKLQFDVAVSR